MREQNESLDSQIASLQASLKTLGVEKLVVMDACFRCGHARSDKDKSCSNCNQQYWSIWDQSWYQSRFINVSLGLNHLARKISNVFAWFCLATLCALAISTYMSRSSAPPFGAITVGLLIGCGAIYDIWAYCHGRTTSIDRMLHEATPRNTQARTLGLLLDAFFLALSFYTLARG